MTDYTKCEMEGHKGNPCNVCGCVIRTIHLIIHSTYTNVEDIGNYVI